MWAETTIDHLIETGWLIHNDGDTSALSKWRERGIECLTALLGADHAYTDFFKAFVQTQGETGFLAATGILFAVRERIAREARAMRQERVRRTREGGSVGGT